MGPTLTYLATIIKSYVYIVYVFLMDSSLEYYEVSSVFLLVTFVLNSILSDISTVTLLSFPFHLLGIFFFPQPFTFSLGRSFVLSCLL